MVFTEIPAYLRDKSTLITQVMFVSIFALVFINLYAPFNAASWTDMSRLEFFFNSSVMILIGMLGIVISKLLFFLSMGRIRMTYLIFGLWHVAELVLGQLGLFEASKRVEPLRSGMLSVRRAA